MPKYRFTAVTASGSVVHGVQKGDSPVGARTELLERGLQPVRIEEKQGILQFELTGRKAKPRDLMHFSRQLAAFIRAGVPILDGLQTIAEETSDKVLRRALYDMIEALRGGQKFAAAATAHPEVFPLYYSGMLGAAELTGNLDSVLDQLAEYMERDLDARQRISSALIYPAIVLVMAIAVVVILTAFVVPRLRVFFEGFDAELPLPTRMLLAIADFVVTWWPLIVASVVFLIVGTALLFRTRWGRAKRDAALLKTPIVRDMLNGVLLERVCRVLATMMQAGVPLPVAMRVTVDSTNNAVYGRGLEQALDAMLRGEGLAAPLAATGLFPASARQMFRVGEETGTLDRQLEAAAIYFDRELEYRIKRFTALFEPAVIVFMGLVVGFVAIAMVSAMYGIYNQINV